MQQGKELKVVLDAGPFWTSHLQLGPRQIAAAALRQVDRCGHNAAPTSGQSKAAPGAIPLAAAAPLSGTA